MFQISFKDNSFFKAVNNFSPIILLKFNIKTNKNHINNHLKKSNFVAHY